MDAIVGYLDRILDALPEQIVVIENDGRILYVNSSWQNFGRDNHGAETNWLKVNYLDECDKAVQSGDPMAYEVIQGIQNVLRGITPEFQIDYPCHNPHQQRWFTMRATAFEMANQSFFLIVHRDVTQRKLAEQEVLKLATIDPLTQVGNRRAFDEFLQREWRRCQRTGDPLCLMLVDIDHFKPVNDNFGHIAGDQSLLKVARLLGSYTGRSGDLCARIGGDEFAVIWGSMTLAQAEIMVQNLLQKVSNIRVPGVVPPDALQISISVGLAEVRPSELNSVEELQAFVDDQLYMAKKQGRGQAVCARFTPQEARTLRVKRMS